MRVSVQAWRRPAQAEGSIDEEEVRYAGCGIGIWSKRRVKGAFWVYCDVAQAAGKTASVFGGAVRAVKELQWR